MDRLARSAAAVRLLTLCTGSSGVRPIVVQALVALLSSQKPLGLPLSPSIPEDKVLAALAAHVAQHIAAQVALQHSSMSDAYCAFLNCESIEWLQEFCRVSGDTASALFAGRAGGWGHFIGRAHSP